jgi:glycine/D-amino acid oxidase-like deaminating enzyme
MELVAGYPYWLIKNGIPYEYPKLLRNAKCEAVIIGGGISGALTAYSLTNAGIECILVDARSIGLGSTCASTSLLQYELDIPLHQLKELVGAHNAIRSYQLCGEAIDKLIDLMTTLNFSKFQKRMSLFFSVHRSQKKFMENEYRARNEADFEVEFLGEDEMARRYGLRAAYGILSHKGAATNAYALTHEILQYCLAKGCKVFDRTRINSINYEGRRINLEIQEGCRIVANYAINATGYEVVNFIEKRIVDLDCTYAVISESRAEEKQAWKDNVMMWNTDDPYLYLCSGPGNRIIVGGRDEPYTNLETMHEFLPGKSAQLETDFKKLFPALSFKNEFAWSGVFGKTKDSLPYIGHYAKTPRTFYALGFGGNGITFSLVAAEIIRDLLSGKRNNDAPIFSFSR